MNRATVFIAIAGFLVGVTACSAARPLPNTTANTAVSPTIAPAATTTGGMAGMNHGSTAMNAPFDAMFIDSMIEHHQGAITMAKDAQLKATKPEIKQLADAIIKAQQSEIDQMNVWRKAWYPDLAPTSGMVMSMGAMSVKEGAEPYDVRFIAAMIPHHESAITMAQQAKQRAEHAEIQKLSDEIITAQTGEITQMKQWYQAWTGKAYSGSM